MQNHDESAKFIHELLNCTPAMRDALLKFDKAVFDEHTGSLDLLVRELIAVGVAVTTQCNFCIADHAKRAVKAGASRQQIAEAVMVATALRAGGGVVHGGHAMKAISDQIRHPL
ncbi:carboxymuconolactone decarboxylase family protein [Pseudomonas aeruginosa]|uniref:carboxymuconolactone decarboxylase family protein n=1 Tax=Pseudomonas aeruginosa TaxID=287 RepID=UPI00298F679D|nr:carboxymuconolactone decarboxylase family protein [Pseudomonas aeruginosa]WPD44481.1 carboxymuconolactone decarboxylase family protein [Pseudomonas aeruginosa]